jgi:cytochrome c oxidase cbb3-type subunit 3
MSLPPPESELRPHEYDGIQEYNGRLPNWWLWTLYLAILFSIGYWGWYQWLRVGPDGPARVTVQLDQIEAEKLAVTAATKLDDASLWTMSRNPVVVAAGRQTFETNCVACHLASLRGKSESPTAIGPDLTDQIWIHGGHPVQVFHTVTTGVPDKGMPTWGPILGPRRVAEVVAYVMSHHQPGEPIIPATP